MRKFSITLEKFFEYQNEGLPEWWLDGICAVRDREGDECFLTFEDDVSELIWSNTAYMIDIIYSDGTFSQECNHQSW